MVQFGVPPREAIATNMALLVLMNLGSSTGFHGEHLGTWTRVARLSAFTAVGSLAGALLLMAIPAGAVRFVIPCAMIGVLLFLLFGPSDPAPDVVISRPRLKAGYATVGVLAIYGGFLSGGYVTLLVTAFTYFFGYTFLRAVALSRLLNIVSSVAAAAVFAFAGSVDWGLVWRLSGFAFAGAYLGARFARRLPDIWLRRIFVIAVAALAIKSLVFDL